MNDDTLYVKYIDFLSGLSLELYDCNFIRIMHSAVIVRARGQGPRECVNKRLFRENGVCLCIRTCMAVVSCELKKVEWDRKWCIFLSVRVRGVEGGGRRGPL